MRWIARVLLAVVLLGTTATEAHEIGTTQATAAFSREGAWTVEFVVDPDALLTRLQVRHGLDVLPADSRALRDAALVRLLPTFVDAVDLRADGTRVQATDASYEARGALADRAQAPGLVRLRGTMPAGTRDVTLAYGLAVGTFALVARVDDGPAQTLWLEGGRPGPAISLAAPPPPLTTRAVVVRYLTLGFTHIVPEGTDHVLFVLGLFLLSARWRPLLLQVSAFTVAHSITLGLTMIGLVSLPARVVEPMIALSIAYVAIENLMTSDLKSWRVALVFAFGLLHGMGFAGVLRDVGLPRADFLPALVSFNLGVEAGQMAVVAMACAALAWWRQSADYRRLVVQPLSVVIAIAGIYWTCQRLL